MTVDQFDQLQDIVSAGFACVLFAVGYLSGFSR